MTLSDTLKHLEALGDDKVRARRHWGRMRIKFKPGIHSGSIRRLVRRW